MMTQDSRNTDLVDQGDQGDRLSIIASRLLQIAKAEGEGYQDIDAWNAPSECYRSVGDRAERETKALLEEFGLTAGQLQAEMESRVTPKWLHFSGLMTHVHDLAWAEEMAEMEKEPIPF